MQCVKVTLSSQRLKPTPFSRGGGLVILPSFGQDKLIVPQDVECGQITKDMVCLGIRMKSLFLNELNDVFPQHLIVLNESVSDLE